MHNLFLLRMSHWAFAVDPSTTNIASLDLVVRLAEVIVGHHDGANKGDDGDTQSSYPEGSDRIVVS
jgi:hypothetical protein